MAIFAILSDVANPALKERLTALYPTELYEITPSQWLVSAESISDVVADQIGIRTGTYGRVVVMRVDSLAGWHNKAIWEWASQKLGSA